MLTIGRLAAYAGVTTRTIRHYHAIGLLPEPERSASGYRSYGAQALVDLRRIRLLTDAGVPLARVGELMAADPDTLRAALAEIDADLGRRIRELQATRRLLATFAAEPVPFLPPEVAELHERIRGLGISPASLAVYEQAWLLIATLAPHLMAAMVRFYASALDDPAFVELFLVRPDEAFHWAEDDPRIEELARDLIAWVEARPDLLDDQVGEVDAVAVSLLTGYQGHASPAWRALDARLAQLARDSAARG